MRITPRPYIHSIAVGSVCALLVAGCGGGSGSGSQNTTDRLVGTYDASVGDTLMSASSNAIGVVEARPDGGAQVRIDIDTLDAIDVTAVLSADGSLALDGSRITGVDEEVPVTGTATIGDSAGERRISGTIEDGNGEGTSFVMVSPTAGTPVSLAGSYIFAFDASPSGRGWPSQATLALSVEENDGRGTHAGGTDVHASGIVLGTLSEGTCIVSSTGRLRCTGAYHSQGSQDSHISESIVLQGSLPSASSAGRGDFVWGSLPAGFLIGGWSTHRLPTWPPMPSHDDPALGTVGNVLISDRLNDRDGQIDGLWIGFSESDKWDGLIRLRERAQREGLIPFIGGRIVPDPRHHLGFFFDPTTTGAAEVTLIDQQIAIDMLKQDPAKAAEQEDVWVIRGLTIEQIVPSGG